MSKCFKLDLSEFNIVSSSNFPTDCAFCIFNSATIVTAASANQSSIFDTNNLGLFCAVCKLSFKPIFSNIDYHIYECEAIINCIMTGDKTSKSSFNKCDRFKDSYCHSYVIANGIDKSICA